MRSRLEGWQPGTTKAKERLSFRNERDRAHVASVIGLAAMRRAPVAEERLRLGIGAAPQILDAADAGAGEAVGGVAGEIEQGAAGARRRHEEARTARIRRAELRDQVGTDLVVALPDHRPERRQHARA